MIILVLKATIIKTHYTYFKMILSKMSFNKITFITIITTELLKSISLIAYHILKKQM